MENKYEIDEKQDESKMFLNFIFFKFNNNILVKYWQAEYFLKNQEE